MSWPSGTFWPAVFQEDHEAFALHDYTALATTENAVLIGCRDGYVRRHRDQHETDEGFEIESYVAYGPFYLGGREYNEGIFAEIIVTLDESSGLMSWWLYVGDSHEEALNSVPATSGASSAGRNNVVRPRRRGGSAVLMIGNGATDRKWAVDSIVATVKPVGHQRPH